MIDLPDEQGLVEQIAPQLKSVKRIVAVRMSLEADGGRRRYRDFNYASFTGWALEGALVNCGAAEWADFE